MQQLTPRIAFTALVGSILLAALALLPARAIAQTTTAFNDGYVVVSKMDGNGSAPGSPSVRVALEEYNPNTPAQGAPNFSVLLPTVVPNRVTISGNSTVSGGITRSVNGRYITVPGYDVPVATTTAGMLNTEATFRIVDGTGGVGFGTKGTFFVNGAANNRSGITDDGSNFWATGNGGGILYAPVQPSGIPTTVSSTSTNTRAIGIFNGQLYFTTGAGSQGLYSVGTGTPTTAGQISTRVFMPLASPANANPTQFSISPDGLTAYVVDNTSGIARYTNTAGT